jgi:WhiB family redox-sensing transcriptional regulator
MRRDTPPRARFLAPADDRWRQHAKCRDADPEMFFPEPSDAAMARAAVAVCRSCPVTEQCLADALHTGERDGIRGGLTPRQRRPLLTAHSARHRQPTTAYSTRVAAPSTDYEHANNGRSAGVSR